MYPNENPRTFREKQMTKCPEDYEILVWTLLVRSRNGYNVEKRWIQQTHFRWMWYVVTITNTMVKAIFHGKQGRGIHNRGIQLIVGTSFGYLRD